MGWFGGRNADCARRAALPPFGIALDELVDTHAHLHDRAFDSDRAQTCARMRASGIANAITVGCDIEDSQRAVACAEAFGLFASVGIHPHEAKASPENIERAFAPFLVNTRVVAIGETGLDYHYMHSPAAVQQSVMRAQIACARRAAMPVIFHHRDAFADFTTILRQEWSEGMRGVVHCFTGDAEQARTYVEEFGLYLGIGGVLTFKNAQHVRDAVAAVGVARLVLETDCPYLAPIPKRGRRNEPAFLRDVAPVLAQNLGLSVASVARATSANARALFALS